MVHGRVMDGKAAVPWECSSWYSSKQYTRSTWCRVPYRSVTPVTNEKRQGNWLQQWWNHTAVRKGRAITSTAVSCAEMLKLGKSAILHELLICRTMTQAQSRFLAARAPHTPPWTHQSGRDTHLQRRDSRPLPLAELCCSQLDRS